MGIERKRTIAIGLQSGRGSSADPGYWFRKLKFDWNRDPVHENDGADIGSTADSSDVFMIRKSASPSMEVNCELDDYGALQYLDCEDYDVTTASGETAVYIHEFTTGNSANDKFATVHVDDPGVEGDIKAIDQLLNNLTTSIDMATKIKASAGLFGGYVSTGSGIPSFDDSPQYFGGRMVYVKFATAVSGLEGASAIKAKGSTINQNSNVDTSEDAWSLGGATPDDHEKQERSVDLTIRKNLQDVSFLDLMEEAGVKALEVYIVNTNKTIGVGSNPFIKFIFPKVSFRATPSGQGGERRKEELTLKAHKGLDDVRSEYYLSKVLVQNTVETYVPA